MSPEEDIKQFDLIFDKLLREDDGDWLNPRKRCVFCHTSRWYPHKEWCPYPDARKALLSIIERLHDELKIQDDANDILTRRVAEGQHQ